MAWFHTKVYPTITLTPARSRLMPFCSSATPLNAWFHNHLLQSIPSPPPKLQKTVGNKCANLFHFSVSVRISYTTAAASDVIVCPSSPATEKNRPKLTYRPYFLTAPEGFILSPISFQKVERSFWPFFSEWMSPTKTRIRRRLPDQTGVGMA